MKLRPCLICNKEFKVYPSTEHDARYCSKICQYKGTLAGLARTPEWRKRIGDKLRGRKVSQQTKEKLREINLGKFSKEKHWNWQGGLSQNKEHVRDCAKKWQIKNIERVRELRRKHGKIQRDRRDAKASRPKSERCEVCESSNKIVFDHDHKTGAFRGWLCNDCNSGLGFLKDNKKTLLNLIKYLEKSDSTLLF